MLTFEMLIDVFIVTSISFNLYNFKQRIIILKLFKVWIIIETLINDLKKSYKRLNWCNYSTK